MVLLPNQIEELLEIIEKNHLIYIGQQIGADSLTRKDKAILRAWGVEWKKFPQKSKIDHSFQFGLLSEALGDKKSKKLTYKQLKKFIKEGKFVKLNTEEKLALRHLKYRGYTDIKNLGGKIQKFVRDFFVGNLQKRRSKYEKILREEGERVIVDRTSIREMKSAIGKKTGDWVRDLDRVVDTVMHETYNTGRVMAIKKKSGDEGKVWMQVYNDACKHCVGLYLTSGLGSKPRIFTIKELQANGNNYGKKSKDWKPVFPPLHPWCRCTTFEYPEGYDWSDEKQLFLPPEVKTKRKKRAKVTIS